MDPEIWVAVIGTVGIVTVALIANSGRRAAKAAQTDAAAARWQVENTHDTNLREESDDRHSENSGLLAQILGTQRAIVSDVRTIRTILDRHSEQIWELEKTQPPQPRKRTPKRE